MSFYVCFGPWATPTLEVYKDDALFRVCLGWVAFGLVRYDLEQICDTAVKIIKQSKSE